MLWIPWTQMSNAHMGEVTWDQGTRWLSTAHSLKGSKSEAILKHMERKGLCFFQFEDFYAQSRGLGNKNIKMKGYLGTRPSSKEGKVVKSSKWIFREGISKGLRESLKSLHRKEIKGQTGAPRQPGVLVRKKFHKALALLLFTKKNNKKWLWKVKGSPVSKPWALQEHTLKWPRNYKMDSFPGRTAKQSEKHVQGRQETWSSIWDITFQGAQEETERKCRPFLR